MQNSPLSPIRLNFFPASYAVSPDRNSTSADYESFFEVELDLSRLDSICSYIYLAGLIEPPEALHMQKMKSREIVITEQIELHMVYHWNQIYIKPLPVWLLNPSLWNDRLCRSDQSPTAIGFLLSYMHLIRHESDFRIAKEKLLLPEALSWKAWLILANELRTNKAPSHKRFQYGMLSLGRLNLIYRCLKFRLIKGYRPFLTVNFADFLQHNFRYFLTMFVYMTVVLSAMQVGLATKQLEHQIIFSRIAMVFAVFSIVLPFCVLSGIMIALIGCGLTMFLETYSGKNKLSQSVPLSSDSQSFRNSFFGKWYHGIISFLGRDHDWPNSGNRLSARASLV